MGQYAVDMWVVDVVHFAIDDAGSPEEAVRKAQTGEDREEISSEPVCNLVPVRVQGPGCEESLVNEQELSAALQMVAESLWIESERRHLFGDRYTVVAFYPDNGQAVTDHVRAESPEEAASRVAVCREIGLENIISVFRGHLDVLFPSLAGDIPCSVPYAQVKKDGTLESKADVIVRLCKACRERSKDQETD